MKNEWSELGVEIKVRVRNEKVKKWMELGVPKLEMVGVLSAEY